MARTLVAIFDESHSPRCCVTRNCSAQDSLRCRSAEQYNNLRFDNADLCFQPGTARADLNNIGLLVQAAFPTRFPLEMLDDVGYVNIITINSGSQQGFIKESPCRSHKRSSLKVFFVARLFAHHHHACCLTAFSKYGLRAQLP